MEVVYKTKLQIGETSRGYKKYWIGYVLTIGSDHVIQTESWQITKNGEESEHIKSLPKSIKGKNIGKRNETTSKEQAIFEINSLCLKQQDKGYYDFDSPPPTKLPLPMLAHTYQTRKHDLVWPTMCGPKLDGTRMLFDGSLGWTRRGKIYNSDIISHLKLDTQGCILDGELILPRPYTFQETVSATKKFGPNTPKLQYHVYDIVDVNLTFAERYKTYHEMLSKTNNPNIIPVKVEEANNEARMLELHRYFVEGGFEGTMIRNSQGKYKIAYRSHDLLKYKDFDDDEFEIVAVHQGEGNDVGTAVFELITKDSKTFTARPTGTREVRQKYYEDRENLIGLMANVKYQGFSDDSIPRFPSVRYIRYDD